ncbi:MAG: hypothetical protein ISR55_04115 [Bacteroidetes bacterium]|nr:hypothetical protein [Bacteroidota bacterium]MBL6962984.1 hypothetical protein [Bacteroidota bacterium]
MKKGIWAVLVTLLFGINFAIAMDNTDEIKDSKVKQAIINEITYPEFAINNKIEGDVFVSFLVNKDGKIRIIRTNSIFNNLESYVIEKMKTMTIKVDDVEIGKTYDMKFSFKLL